MITYEDIAKANNSIRTTDIKGKEYAEVNQRIKAFRMVYPTGYIETKMLSNEKGVCIFRAEVGISGTNEDRGFLRTVVLGVGHAYEKEGSTFINKTSYIENCETSAVGRALGMAGFGIDTSVASAEEVENAMLNQGYATEMQVNALRNFLKNKGINEKDALKKAGAKSFNKLTVEQYNTMAMMGQ